MTITTNTTLIRVFLNSDVEVKKLKKKRYLIKVTLDNGMAIQLNDVPFEINSEFIDFKLNNGNQLIAKQLVDAAIAVLVKTPTSITVKVIEDEQQEDNIMNNDINETNTTTINETNQTNKEEINMKDIINRTKEIITTNDELLKYYTSGTLDLDTAVSALTLPLSIVLSHLQDEESKEELVDRFFRELAKPSKETRNNVEDVAKAMANFEEKLTKLPEAMEINRQGVEQLKASCNKIAKEAEEVVSGKQPQKQSNDKSSLDTVSVNTASTPEKEESLLYTTAKVAGKAVGLAAIGYVGYLAYGFIKNKLSN